MRTFVSVEPVSHIIPAISLLVLTNDFIDINLANTLIDEFPCRPHWTKNTRDVFTRAVKNLDPDVSLPQRCSYSIL